MHTSKAQKQPKTKNPIHNAATTRTRAQIQAKTVPLDSGASRILLVARSHRSAS